MNVLVTGANGQLGSELRIAAQGSACKYVFTDVLKASEETVAMLRKLGGEDVNTDTRILDITDIDAVRALVKAEGIDVIVNCAAYTNVDKAETDVELAELLNAKAPENLARAMKEAGGLLVHISTDYVFGKEIFNTPCREDMKGAPTGVYGLTKLHGEEKILVSGCRSIILRTGWLYSEFGKNFVRTILNLTATRPELKVVFDQVGTPTYAYDLAEVIKLIIERSDILNSQFSIFNYSNEGVCSWYDFAKMISDYSNHKECKILPCHSDEFPSPVKRPSYSVLDKTKIKETFAVEIPYWTDSLRKCINNL